MKINKIIKAIINNQTMKINCKIMKKNISKKKIKKERQSGIRKNMVLIVYVLVLVF